jgi:hypothetical protein
MFGLSFLNSLFLWGLAAAAVPVIIHLIKRSRAIKLPFAAMRFLAIDPNQRIRSQKWKQLLLLLMRVSAIILLALAFARPFFKNVHSNPIWGEGPKAAVILVDNSFSMGYENRLGAAVSKARELLATFKPGDNATVMMFSEKVETVGETDQDYAGLGEQLARAAQVSARSTNYLRTIQAAETRLLELPLERKTIYLISDLQATGLDNLHLNWKIQPGIQLEFISAQRSNLENVAVREVLVSSKHERGSNRDVLVRIKNFGGETRSGDAVLTLNGRDVSQKSFSVDPQDEEIVQFNHVVMPEGAVSGVVELKGSSDALDFDDRYFFVLQNIIKSKILAVNGEPNQRDVTQDELFFLERAVNVGELAKYSLVQVGPQRMAEQDFSEYQVIVLANVKELGRSVMERLTYFVRSGGGLVIALGDQVNTTIFNQLFRELSPATLEGRAFSSLRRESSVILTDIDYQHTIFRMFSDARQGDPSTAQFHQYFQSTPIAAEAVLARFDDGGPALMDRKIGSGKVILYTSTIDTEWNNLPVKAIFLPMLYQTIQYVAAENRGHKSYLAGAPVKLQNVLESDIKSGGVSVRIPSGDDLEVTDAIFDQTEAPGIYEVHRKNRNRTREVFAINVDTRESDLTPMSAEEFQSKFVVENGEKVQSAGIAANSDQQEDRQQLWRLAILGVILLLVGETWLANRTYR